MHTQTRIHTYIPVCHTHPIFRMIPNQRNKSVEQIFEHSVVILHVHTRVCVYVCMYVCIVCIYI